MKVYYIWSNQGSRIVKSNDYKSGIYTDIVSVSFAYSRLDYQTKKVCVIKEAGLNNINVIHGDN